MNNLLFDQLEKLKDAKRENSDDFEFQVARAKSMTGLAKEIIEIAKLSLDAEIAFGSSQIKRIPRLISSQED